MSHSVGLRNILIISLIFNFILSSCFLYGCFGEKKTEGKKQSKTKELSDKEFLESVKKGIVSRVDLLSLKYGIQSEELKQDIIKFVMKYDLTVWTAPHELDKMC
jgi:hypothetical protein